MRAISLVKIVLLAAAVALPVSFSAAEAKMKLPPGACAIGKKGVLSSGAACSYQCSTVTNTCAQQTCWNGALNQIWPCFGPFCAPKCGG